MLTFLALVVFPALPALVTCEYKYDTRWFEVPLDHFSYKRNETFKIKYLVNDDYWDKGGGPILFYTGNEGQIELFAQHTGFMWDIAEQFNARLVFAEHRYYGASMPFGDKSLDKENIGYLTSAQALADYADLLDFLQGYRLQPQLPVIAIGGSYGGMLAAYFRMKYPHAVAGAIAASAPVHMYPDMVPCEVYFRIVTSSFKYADPVCAQNIRQSWPVIRNAFNNQTTSDALKKSWNLCDPVKNSTEVDILVGFLKDMYSSLAMVNYPFSSDFLMPLPAHPVRVVCQYLNKPLEGDKLLEAIGKVLNIFTNYSGKERCVDYIKGSDYGNLNASGWDYQACTEMVMPMCTTGKDDMFEPQPWNYTAYAEACHQRFGVYPRPRDAWRQYGGDRLQAASNIVFSNGLLDPWAGGGILNSISETVKAVVLVDTAHHLDLMASHEEDPASVKVARDVHKQNIRRWIRDFRMENNNFNYYKV